MKEKEKYNINDFWPQAEDMLNKHFRLRRLFKLLGASIFSVAVILGLLIFNAKNKINTIVLKSNENRNQSQPKLNSESNKIETPSNEIPSIESEQINNSNKINSQSKTAFTENVNSNAIEIDYAEQKVLTKAKQNKSRSNKSNLSNQSNFKNTKNNATIILSTNLVKKNKDLKKIDSKIYSENNLSEGSNALNNQTKEKVTAPPTIETKSQANLLDPRINKYEIMNLLNSKESSPINLTYTTSESLQKQELKNSFLKNKKLFWAVFAQIGYFNTSKSIKTLELLASYQSRRKEEEQSNFVLNYGAGLKLWYRKFALNVGVDYSNYSENVNYENWKNGYSYNQKDNWNVFYTPSTSVDTLYYQGIQYPNANTVLVKDSTKTSLKDSIYGRINNEGINQYNGKTMLSYAEFPIIAEYNFVFNKFSIGLNGGISPGIATFRSGYYISKNQESFEDVNTNTEFRKWIWNARAGINVHYKISHGLEIYIQPQYRTNLSSVFNSSSGIKQKYTSIGTSMGLLFWF